MTETPENTIEPLKDKLVKKNTAWVFYLFITLLFTIGGLIFSSRYLIGEFLSYEVAEKTNGAYQLSFEGLRVKWFERQVILKNAAFDFVGTDTLVNTTEIHVSEVFIDVHRLADIYLERSLKVIHIAIDNPEIWINKKVNSNSNFSIATGDLYKALNGVVHQFELNNLHVSNMKLHYKEKDAGQPIVINDLSFQINNFKLDSNAIATKDDFFFTESFNLKMADQWFEMKETQEMLHFDSLIISTSQNIVEVYNLTLDTTGKQTSNTQFTLKLPYAGFVGIDFLKAYQTNVLHVDSLIFNSPDLYGQYKIVHKKKKKLARSDNKSNPILQSTLSVFESVDLNRFILKNAKINGVFLAAFNAKVKQFDIDINGFKLDSTDLQNERYFPQYDSFSFQIAEPEFVLNKKDHVQAQLISYQSSKQIIKVQDVSFKREHNTQSTDKIHAAYGKIKSILIKGVSPESLMQEKITINTLEVNSPSTHIEWLIDNSTKDGSLKPINLNSALFPNIEKEIIIKRFRLKNANLAVTNSALKTSIANARAVNLSTNYLTLNSKTSMNQLLNRTNLQSREITAVVASIQHKVKVVNVAFSGAKKRLAFAKAKINPQITDSSSLKFISNVELNQLELLDLHLADLINQKPINLSRVALGNSIINHTILVKDTAKKTTKNIIPETHLANVNIGKLNCLISDSNNTLFKIDSFYVSTPNVNILPATDSSSLDVITDSLSYGALNLYLPLRKIKHMLQIGEVRHKTAQTSVISNLVLRPIPGVKVPDSVMRLKAFVPEILVSDNKVFEAANRDTIEISNLTLYNPVINLKLPEKEEKHKKASLRLNSVIPLLSQLGLTHFLLDTFNIYDANLNLASPTKNGLAKIQLEKINLRSAQWNFSTASSFTNSRFLWAEVFKIGVAGINYDFPNFKLCNQLDSLNYEFNSQENTLQLNGIYLSNWKENHTSDTSSISAYLPTVKFINPQIATLLNSQKLQLDSIIITTPTVDALLKSNVNNSNSQKKTKTDNSTFKAPNKLGGLNNINVNRIEVNNIASNISTNKNGIETPIDIGSITATIDSFNISPNELMDSNKVFWSSDVNIKINDFETTVDKGLYGVHGDEITVSTASKTLLLNGIKFNPTVYRYEYALHKGYRKDVFDVDASEIHVKKIDFYKMLAQKEFEAEALLLKDINLDILKDKRIPLPEYKYKAIIPEMFKQLPVTISTDTIAIENMDIRYEEFPEEGRAPGEITLKNMNVFALNVTNDTLALMGDSTLNIYMNAKFLGEGDLHLELNYNMLDSLNAFTMHTTLGEMDGTLMNAYLVPAFRVEVNSLNVEKMEMNAIGNDTVSGGLMGFFYDDLKFTFLKENDKGQWLKSVAGNTVIGKNKRYHALRKGKPVYFKRDDSKGWIGYLIRIELSGIQSNVGLASYNKKLKAIDKKLWKEFLRDDKKLRKLKAKEEKRKHKSEKAKNQKVE